MKIFLLEQDVNSVPNTYDCMVVVAESEEDAKALHPDGGKTEDEMRDYDSWCALRSVWATYIGEALPGAEEGIICKSFNAG